MLELAAAHSAQLREQFQNMALNPDYKWFHINGWIATNWSPHEDTWGKIELVSIQGQSLTGYLSATVDRSSDTISQIGAMSFGQNPLAYAADIRAFFRLLLTRFRRLEWSVVVGNPAEFQYDRLCTRLGGRVVGTFTQSVRLPFDEGYHDLKWYEVLSSTVRGQGLI